ncbi:hypothetical protein AVEN_83899-1 [Araneus ventricosus]|uniref:Uncharacterized protein n=1 Tax=Araneus ventricosus TaxID=182803 RepID=A0A4Y2M145_ARAVE|nr:hypothetical protein AVEN_83899-1 [Araneus ventricosus]
MEIGMAEWQSWNLGPLCKGSGTSKKLPRLGPLATRPRKSKIRRFIFHPSLHSFIHRLSKLCPSRLILIQALLASSLSSSALLASSLSQLGLLVSSLSSSALLASSLAPGYLPSGLILVQALSIWPRPCPELLSILVSSLSRRSAFWPHPYPELDTAWFIASSKLGHGLIISKMFPSGLILVQARPSSLILVRARPFWSHHVKLGPSGLILIQSSAFLASSLSKLHRPFLASILIQTRPCWSLYFTSLPSKIFS